MIYNQLYFEDLKTSVQLSAFKPAGMDGEYHAMIELVNPEISAKEQFESMEQTIERLMQTEEIKGSSLVLKRYFLSDSRNQAPYVRQTKKEAVSVVQQPPLNGAKLSLWLYFVANVTITTLPDGAICMKHSSYAHLYHTQMHERVGDVNSQTDSVFGHYTGSLAKLNCSLDANCIRTWIYIQDVDVQYQGMVDVRKFFFLEAGLTTETHYIASTGIEGRYIHPEVLMLMDAYAIPEIRKEQITYLYAPTHLNPTEEYGVTFERGTSVDYGDRRHIFISGTASINNKGEIVYPLNIDKQTERTLENIQVLLAEAGASMTDIAQMIVYLRDTADYNNVKEYLEKHYPETPKVIVWAPVCRPGWLVEIECIAMVETGKKEFAVF